MEKFKKKFKHPLITSLVMMTGNQNAYNVKFTNDLFP